MRKYLFLIILGMIMFVPSVIASTPDYSMTELLEDKVSNGVSDFGDLLFVEKVYQSEHHVASLIQNYSYQQYDIMDWYGVSANVLDPSGSEQVIVSGSKYYFATAGVYTISSMVDSTIKDYITVSIADENTVEITDIDVPTGIEVNFSTYSFTLEDEKDVTATIKVDDDIEKGDYELTMNINGVAFTKEFEVLENINWTYDIDELNTSTVIKAGEGEYLGRIVITNQGNEDVEITTTKTGNQTDMLSVPQTQTLYRKNTVNLDFQAQVPTIRKSGVYEYDIKISGGGLNYTIPLNITVVDSINPVIESIEFSTDIVYVDNNISVVATDNDDVEKVIMSINDETDVELDKDSNLFTTTYQFNKLSRYVLEFCAYDVEENEACERMNKTFSQREVINETSKILNMPSVRYGKYSSLKLFNIVGDIENGVTITLDNYDDSSVGESSTPIFRIVDEDGSIKNFGQYDSQITLTDIGEYTLQIRADYETDISGILTVEMGEQYEQISDITFKVSFKSYDIPEDFSVNWLNGRDMVCNVNDTGNLDTSFYSCLLTYPIDTRADDISIPTTVSENEDMEQEIQDIQTQSDKDKAKSGWIIGILIGVLLVTILWAVFIITWYPYMRIQTGKTKALGGNSK